MYANSTLSDSIARRLGLDYRCSYDLEYALFRFLTTDFDIFQAVVIFISVIFTEYLIMDGSSNWMEGSMLLGIYAIVAIAYWLYPNIDMKP